MQQKKPASCGLFVRYELQARSDGTGNLAAAEAPGARVNVLRGTVDHRLAPLNVGLPGPVGTSVGMADLDPENNALFAEFTLRHRRTSLTVQ